MSSFKTPVIGPKSYIAQGTSGWPESFPRKKSDCELEALLVTHGDPTTMIDLFVLDQEIQPNGKKKPIEWGEVLGFLARITGIPQGCIPVAAAISFWARVMLHQQTPMIEGN